MLRDRSEPKGFLLSCFGGIAITLTIGGSFCVLEKAQAQNSGRPAASGRAVRFTLKDHPNAKSVALAGTFNNWNTQSTPMTRKGADWSVSINLAPGTYRYKFVVDKDRWTIDPEN